MMVSDGDIRLYPHGDPWQREAYCAQGDRWIAVGRLLSDEDAALMCEHFDAWETIKLLRAKEKRLGELLIQMEREAAPMMILEIPHEEDPLDPGVKDWALGRCDDAGHWPGLRKRERKDPCPK